MLYDVTLQGPSGNTREFLVSADTDERAGTAALRRIARNAAVATRAGWLVVSTELHWPLNPTHAGFSGNQDGRRI